MPRRNVIDFKNRRNFGILSVCPQRKKLKRALAAPKPRQISLAFRAHLLPFPGRLPVFPLFHRRSMERCADLSDCRYVK